LALRAKGKGQRLWKKFHNLRPAKKFSTDQKAMIAARLRPFYEAQAKERQREQAKINQPQSQKVEKNPLSEKGKARDEAGKAADF
jgi:hypothetical protein